jgi:hypothetical protein
MWRAIFRDGEGHCQAATRECLARRMRKHSAGSAVFAPQTGICLRRSPMPAPFAPLRTVLRQYAWVRHVDCDGFTSGAHRGQEFTEGREPHQE